MCVCIYIRIYVCNVCVCMNECLYLPLFHAVKKVL